MEPAAAPTQSAPRVDSLAGRRGPVLAGVAGLAASVLYLSSKTGGDGTSALGGVVRVATREGLLAALWWAAAAGIGLVALRLVRPRASVDRAQTTPDDLAIAITLGAAALLAAESLLGSLGVLTVLGGVVAWGSLGAGVFALGRSLSEAPFRVQGEGVDGRDALTMEGKRSERERSEREGSERTARVDDETEAASARPPIRRDLSTLALVFGLGALAGLLAVAASTSPGWLWSSEFGGYDALSYHLTLPKHWFETGSAVGPVAGNTYAYLPGFVEAAFLHLMALRGDAIQGAFACQWWAAIGALATAFVVGRLARACLALDAMPVAALVLSVPWIVVVGTLAYNDIAPCTFLAGAWLLLARTTRGGAPLDARVAAALALIAAAAFGAKPTALLFVLLPLLAVTLASCGMRALRYAPIVVGVAIVVLVPWLARNAIATGNPFFPFLTGILGRGAWSEEQVAVFASAHGPSVAWGARLELAWSEWIAHGFGAAPAPGEPWFPQWSALPALGLVGLTLASLRVRVARAALVAVAVMLAGWLVATHCKSRFLLPTAVPLALGAAFALERCAHWLFPTSDARARRIVRFAALLALLAPFAVYLREPVKGTEELQAPAALVDSMPLMTGEALAQAVATAAPDARAGLLSQATTPFAINHLVPDEARVIAIGFATPFYIRRPIDTTMVWERGALDAVAAEFPQDPARWGAELAAKGFTHALIEPAMLERWSASGWLNPALASGAWLEPFVRANTPILRTVDGKVLVGLGEAKAPPQPR